MPVAGQLVLQNGPHGPLDLAPPHPDPEPLVPALAETEILLLAQPTEYTSGLLEHLPPLGPWMLLHELVEQVLEHGVSGLPTVLPALQVLRAEPPGDVLGVDAQLLGLLADVVLQGAGLGLGHQVLDFGDYFLFEL